jgi:AcrR family transcriptional regulator
MADVSQAAYQVFVEKGYRGALMTDVADVLGLSHGVLYRYVESKEALFALAVRRVTDPDSVATLDLPLPTPAPGETVSTISGWLRASARLPALAAARKRDRADDVHKEFAGIVEEHYDVLTTIYPVLTLVERAAADLPELYSAYYARARRGSQDLFIEYVRRRVEAGQMRPVPDAAAAARFAIESIAWFAWHRRGDPDAAMFDEDVARDTVRHLLVEAFCKEGT